MPRGRTRRYANDVAEEQSFSRPSTTPSEGSNKRVRLGGDSPSSPLTPSRKGKNAQAEYQIGSIVRVSLKNFVTYDSVEFRPGPNLNMIIGPNGTGKSTIVCAIALGLGWNSSLLGRAKDISDFIKNGQERASIEIELQSRPKNVMSPPELLMQTQRAVGEKELITWHERLIKLREEEKKLLATTKVDSDEIDNLEKRNSILERDVTRFKEREAILRRIQLYELRIPFARYGVAKNLYDEIKNERAEAHSTYKRLLKENEPANARKSELEDKLKEAGEENKRCLGSYNAKTKEMKETANKLEKTEGDIDNARKELSSIKRRERTRQNLITQLRAEINDLEERTKVPPRVDTSDIDRRNGDINRRLREVSSQIDDINEKIQQKIEESRNYNLEIISLQKQLKELDNVRRLRLDILRNDYDTISAIEWIRKNGDKLVARVYDPMLLEIDIKNMRYADAVESLLGNSTKTFVCESDQDYHTITKALCDIQKLRINVLCISHLSMKDFPYPRSIEQLRAIGFEGYLLDQINAPPMLLTAICDQANFHRIPVAKNETDVNHNDILRRPEIRKYIAGNTSYSITSSKYGKKLSQTYTTRIRPARIFTNTLNVEQRRNLERQLQEVQLKLQENDRIIGKLRNDEAKLNESVRTLREEKARIIEEKRSIQASLSEFERLKVKLDNKRSQLERQRPNPVKDDEKKLRGKIREFARKRGRLVAEFQDHLKESKQLFSDRIVASLQHIQYFSELHELERRTKDRNEALKQAHVRYVEVDGRFSSAKANAKRLLNEANAKIEDVDEETRLALQEISQGMSLDELEDAVASERAKADLHYVVNPHVIEMYDKRKAEIESIKSRLVVKTRELEKLTEELSSLKEKWVPKLEELVKKISQEFSNAFDREVRVSTHDDYDKWGIDILVKFRDNEKLQALTGQRQSGGFSIEYDNSTVDHLRRSQSWKELFLRLGEVAMTYLLRNASIFIALPNKSYLQVVGTLISEIPCSPSSPSPKSSSENDTGSFLTTPNSSFDFSDQFLESDDDFANFPRHAQGLSGKFINSVIVDRVKESYVDKEVVLDLLEEHLKNNLIKANNWNPAGIGSINTALQ
ncbi:2028_t:CDS:10, partial [Acaulospora colombiana]